MYLLLIHLLDFLCRIVGLGGISNTLSIPFFPHLPLFWTIFKPYWASLVSKLVKNLPAMLETWVQFLGWEDTLQKEMAIHSNILAWKISWTEEPGGLQSMGSQE